MVESWPDEWSISKSFCQVAKRVQEALILLEVAPLLQQRPTPFGSTEGPARAAFRVSAGSPLLSSNRARGTPLYLLAYLLALQVTSRVTGPASYSLIMS
jgi:hypothetical protein